MARTFNNNNDEISLVAQPQRQYRVSDESSTSLVLDTGDSILRLDQLIQYNQLRRVSKKMDLFVGLHMQPKCTGLYCPSWVEQFQKIEELTTRDYFKLSLYPQEQEEDSRLFKLNLT